MYIYIHIHIYIYVYIHICCEIRDISLVNDPLKLNTPRKIFLINPTLFYIMFCHYIFMNNDSITN